MIGFFFKCIACEVSLSLSPDLDSFPLCQICLQSLVDCPSLCPECGSAKCMSGSWPTEALASLHKTLPTPVSCQYPWIRRRHITSYSARYLLVGRSYLVLRKWKMHGGLLFNRKVLKSNSELIAQWKKIQPEAVIPIPQSFNRAWKLRGSRVELLANWVSTELQIPVAHLLSVPDLRSSLRSSIPFSIQSSVQSSVRSQPVKRQAERTWLERLENTVDFSTPGPSGSIQRAILVDDFMTTGKTVEKAAQRLHSLGVSQIHVFCLGIRSLRVHS